MCLKKFGNNSVKNCGLCTSHYFIAPALSWDAMLKITKIKLELIPDPEIYIYSLRKVQEMEFLIFLTDKAKSAIYI